MFLLFVYNEYFISIFHEYCQDKNIGVRNSATGRRRGIRIGLREVLRGRSGKGSPSAIPVISKRGKADLRYVLYQADLIASVQNPDFIMYYAEKLRGREREPGIKIKMRVKLAAKLLLIAWTLMKKKKPFDPSTFRVAGRSFSTGGGRER
jgi:hypothetical protein